MSTPGLLLAAGAGRRRGGPKALAHDPDGTSWLVRSLHALADGGCAPLVVVLGAGADQARALVPDDLGEVDVVQAADWSEGMAASLRAGLVHLVEHHDDAVAALVSLVDLPDVDDRVVARVRAAGHAAAGPAVLARASYAAVPGHPVLIGREHWTAIVDRVEGDSGARDYLASRDVALVECRDLATGADQDT